MSASSELLACHCCGLVQRRPPAGALVARATRLRCVRCHTPLGRRRSGNDTTAALALAALVLLPLGVTLPVLRLERLGHLSEASIWSGGVSLLADGQLFVGLVVLVCSVLLPLLKLIALFTLAGGGPLLRPRMRALTWRLVEWTGRWGMLDVLLVALLVAAVKLGEMAEITAGPGVVAFTACVLFNLLASASFDPHASWNAPAEAAPTRIPELRT